MAGQDIPNPGAAGEAAWRAAIGPRADFYLSRFRTMAEKGTKTSWNWAACLLSVFWFAWRKMPVQAVLFALAFIALAAAGAIRPEWLRPTMFASVAVGFITGTYGNHFYRERIAGLTAETSDETALRQKGGVSNVLLAIAIVGFVAAMVLVPMALAPVPAP